MWQVIALSAYLVFLGGMAAVIVSIALWPQFWNLGDMSRSKEGRQSWTAISGSASRPSQPAIWRNSGAQHRMNLGAALATRQPTERRSETIAVGKPLGSVLIA